MSTFHNRSTSLIERKRLQWAKEREELASLGAPWGPPDKNLETTSGRYAAKVSTLHNDYLRKDYRENRRNSLPPLYKNQYNSYDRYEREKELGGETSGYGSDNPNHTPDCKDPNWHHSGYESSSSRDDRPKWGDKGVGVGKFWQPKDEPFDESQTNEPPNWVKRGLQDGEIVVTNTSPAESPEQRYEETDRPCTGSSYSLQRSYIRGQNIPIDSVELAERERRRQVAMAHQEAVRQQLEEREKKRREDREKRIQEEQEEELRIEKEQELERQRKEKELKILREKQERERRRKEAIQEAIELAQKTAMLEKTAKKMNKQANNNNNIISSVAENDKFSSSSITESLKKSEITDKQNEDNNNNNEQLNNTRIIPTKCETLNNEINNNLDIKDNIRNSPISPKEKPTDSKSLPPIPSPREHVSNNNHHNTTNHGVSVPPLFTPRTENLALVIQTPLESLHNLQYALLVPATPQAIPIAVPASVPQVDRSCNTSRTENRILTPTQYRHKNRRVCDSSTQTEDSDFGRTSAPDIKETFIREKFTNLESNYENRNRKERRSRSESLEERPKWGANRPPTRYIKQSEKDPLYQRRKLRQKMRDCKSYDEKISSDESQTATTPRSYRKKSYVEKRHARALWKNHDHVFTRNIRMYQTEIIPLESDKDQIYYKTHECCCICKCERRKNSRDIKVDILKIERTSPRENAPYKAEFIESSDRIQDSNLDDTNSDVFEKLSSLQSGLMLKQEQWETCPSTPSLPSAHRN